jgi:hypothetical protein
LYEDWTGGSCLGIRCKAGGTPGSVVNAETGEAALGITEPADEEIVEILTALYSSYLPSVRYKKAPAQYLLFRIVNPAMML